MQQPALILKPGKEKPVLNRHPWIFSGAVRNLPNAEAGDIVAVKSAEGRLLGYGHFAPGRTLICRLFAFTGSELHITADWWMEKLRDALRYRRSLPGLEGTTGYRLVHAEGDGLPGVVIDLFGRTASVQLRTEGARNLQSVITQFLTQQMDLVNVYVQTEKEGNEDKDGKGEWIAGGPGENEFVENGIRFHADVETGQKTGFFLDQRDNRAMLRTFAAGRKVANLFSYTGGFSMYALAGGAREVLSVDLSEPANEKCRTHAALNFGATAAHTALKADCFAYLKEMPADEFDLVVLDPPAFTKHASTVDRAARGYKEINLKALQKIAPGGFLFTFSCSQHISKDLFRKIVFGAAADAGRAVRLVSQLTQAPDHPVSIFHPEGEYLKGLVLQVS